MNNLNNFTLNFGKYKSKNLFDIYNENPAYLDWIIKTFDKENLVYKKVVEFLNNKNNQ